MKTVQKRNVTKIAALCIKNRKLLVVYKPSIGLYITPGGKLEQGETALQCLKREMKEELRCSIKTPTPFSTHHGKTDDGRPLRLCCYRCRLQGRIKLNPRDSITGYRRISLDEATRKPMAPLLKNQIIPKLVEANLI